MWIQIYQSISIHHLRMMVYQCLVNVDSNHHHPFVDPFMEPSFGSQMAWPQLAKRLQRATKRPSACLSCIRPGRLGPVWAPKDSWASWVIQNLNILNLTYGYVWLIDSKDLGSTTSKEDLGSMSPFFGGKQLRFLTIQILFKLWHLWFLDFPSICPTNQQPRKALLKSKFLGHAAKEPCSCTGSDWVQPESSILYIKPPQIEQ